MARQIQIRRGTTAQNNNFTGAVGEVTMDTDAKTLRVHDGVTPGGVALARADAMDGADYVIAFQAPTAANNYTWYRKYKSGWVEQGGIARSVKCVFMIPMAGTDYVWMINSLYNSTSTPSYAELGELAEKTSTGFTKAGNAQVYAWVVRGIAAS